MSKNRFQVSVVPNFTMAVAVKVKDTETGNSAIGSGSTQKEAEKKAWEKLKEKQGPTPSEIGKQS